MSTLSEHLSQAFLSSQTPATADGAANTTRPAQDQTTLLQNENESFALAPVDASAVRGGFVRTKRKRKLIVDEIKAISGEEMKAQLSDTQVNKKTIFFYLYP